MKRRRPEQLTLDVNGLPGGADGAGRLIRVPAEWPGPDGNRDLAWAGLRSSSAACRPL
jgi:hypothetical protein